mgnify:CR=1 FL=1
MEAEFWQTRWQRGETGFHKSRINPLLSRWWPALQVRPSARVWVPLCGKSLDMLWLRDQGYEVQGVELARTAIESFISEQKLALTWQQQDEFDVAIGAGFELLCGDFFKLTAEQMKDITAVYDRAALIATYSSHIAAGLADAAGDPRLPAAAKAGAALQRPGR